LSGVDKGKDKNLIWHKRLIILVLVATSDIKEDEEEFKAEASVGGIINIIVDPLVTGLISKSTGGDVPDLEGILYDIAHYMSKVPLDRITEFETAQRQLEAVQLVASRERASLADRVATSNIKEDEEEFNADASLGGMINIIVDPLVTGLISKSTGGDVPDLEGILYDIAHYMSKVPLDRITEFETAQRQLEAVQLVASRERASLADRVSVVPT
nr:hypothetical protein [Tanacetum cinerariifolium]